MTLETDINKFMDEHYRVLPLYDIREPKVIHMTKLGTHHFFQHEIAVIDTPIIQRLKYISQLGGTILKSSDFVLFWVHRPNNLVTIPL